MKKILTSMAATTASIALGFGLAAPAQAYNLGYEINGCDGGSSALKVDIGVEDGANSTWIVDVHIYDDDRNNNNHHWDWWLYRDGTSIRNGSDYGYTFHTWVVNDPPGPDVLKWRAANNSRTINCVVSLAL